MKYFTKVFRDQLIANKNVLDGRNLRLVLFRNAPSGEGATDYTNVPTVTKLIDGNYPGWELVTATGYSSPYAVTSVVKKTSAYIFIDNGFTLTGLAAKTEVAAIGVEVVGTLWGETNPLVFVSNEMFPKGRVVLDKDDVIVARDDPGPPPPATPAPVGKWLMAWDDTSGGVPVSAAQRGSSLTLGDLAVAIGPPDYTCAHHFNAWLYPQRVNYVANPSFEAITNKFWASNGTFTRVASPAGGYAGQFVGESLAIETNTFPTEGSTDGLWTMQLLVKGTGRLSLGLVYWRASYDETYVDWGTERWDLSPDTFLPIKVLRGAYEAVEAMLRIQVEGGTGITIDQVLAEPGPLLDWPYFDGDTQFGAKDDFSWYGVRGESYSLWYNNKRSIISRIFAMPMYTGNVYTADDAHGLAYNWVPAGTMVRYHVDVLRPDDLKAAPLVKTGVMPDDVADPIFGVPGGNANILTTEGSLVTTPATEEVYIAGGS